MTSTPSLMAMMVAELMTPLMPAAGPPPTSKAMRPESKGLTIYLPRPRDRAFDPCNVLAKGKSVTIGWLTSPSASQQGLDDLVEAARAGLFESGDALVEEEV